MAKTREVPVQGDEQQTTGQPKVKGYTEATPTGTRKAGRPSRAATPTHQSRNAETRAAAVVHEMDDAPWVPASKLPAIPQRDGYRRRWIRAAWKNGESDPGRLSAAYAEGWRAVDVASLPAGSLIPTVDFGGNIGTCISVLGMILMELPEGRAKARDAYFRDKNNRMTASVNEQLAQVSAQHGGGFGPIQKAEKSGRTHLREVVASDE